MIFEPHNGFGSRDPDGDLWPFGYISNDLRHMPIFELTPILLISIEELTATAIRMAAADELLAALEGLLEAVGGEESTDIWCRDARAAIAKAKGREP
jgi:hypothetical protein